MKISLAASIVLAGVVFSGCSVKSSFLPSSGPSTSNINANQNMNIKILDVDEKLIKKIAIYNYEIKFSDIFNNGNIEYLVDIGDVLDINIIEAAPAALFGTFDIMGGPANKLFTGQMVQSNGKIYIPFAGEIYVAGKTLREIEKSIASRLQKKANDPQVIVALSKNVSHNITIIGETNQNMQIPLTPGGERLLDAIAIAGGAKQQVNKINVQLTRGKKTINMPLESIINDPKENIMLRPKDVITVLYKSKSFTALGATGKNEEIEFEAKGITLAQALGRIGGLKDNSADNRGVFLFRWENQNIVEDNSFYKDRKAPVIYRFDLSNPSTFFMAQNFTIKDKDILYVSNASSVELQKFINILTSSMYAIATPVNLTR